MQKASASCKTMLLVEQHWKRGLGSVPSVGNRPADVLMPCPGSSGQNCNHGFNCEVALKGPLTYPVGASSTPAFVYSTCFQDIFKVTQTSTQSEGLLGGLKKIA